MLARRSPVVVLACFATLSATSSAQVTRVTAYRVSTVAPRWLGSPAESPDGRFIVAAGDSALYEFDRTTKQWTRLADESEDPRWSPTGRFVAYARHDPAANGFRIWVLPIDPRTGAASGPERRVTLRDGRRPAWSPDGSQIAFISIDSGWVKIWIQPFNGGEEKLAARVRGWTNFAPAWSPDGKTIFFSYGPTFPGHIAKLTLATGHVDSVVSPGFFIGLSKDGRFIAQAAARQSTILISSASDGREIKRVIAPPGASAIAWSMSNPSELVGVENPIWSEIHAVSLADGSTRRLVAGDSISAAGIELSPDRTRLVYTVGTRLVISQLDGSGSRTVKTPVEVARGSATWSPDGSRIAYLSTEPRELHVVELQTGNDSRLAQPFGLRSIPYVWRHDGGALRFVTLDERAGGRSQSVHEVNLSGRDSLLASVPDSVPPGSGYFMSDSLLEFEPRAQMMALNLKSGRMEMLSRPQVWNGAVSADGKVWAFSVNAASNSSDQVIRLVQGGVEKTIPNPFGGYVSQMHFLPDNRNIIAAICQTCVSGVERRSLVLIPTNGDPPRVLSGKQGSILDWNTIVLTPDGKTVIYDPELAWRTAILHIPVELPGVRK